jgi:predicted phage baseplate assembly protein
VPTGDENVTATYRTGIGTDGMVKAGQLSLLMTRPLGVQKVTNPLAPTGAADLESRAQARQNAPFTVLTLDRIVSLKDFENFARAFAGIGKARATWLWDSGKRMVHVTIAAAASNGSDYTVDPKSDLFINLQRAIDAARDTVHPVHIASYAPLFVRLEAGVLIDQTYVAEKVLAAVTEALQHAYSFSQRDFAQPVQASEVLALLQHVQGVKAAFLQTLYFRGAPPSPATALPAREAVLEGNTIKPAQLLLLDPNGIHVTEVKS